MADGSLALGEFLRARRNVCQPEDVGIHRDPRRRVPGLRRDEVARIAGISAEYYLRLEQGRGSRPSDQVLNALARALLLDADSRQYLFRIASGDIPSPVVPDAESAERIARLLGHWTHTPAYVSDSNRDIVAANPLATVLGHGGLSAGSNVVLDLFVPRMKRTVTEWELMTRAALAGLRRDADPSSPRLRQIIDELSGARTSRRLWSRYDVSGREDARIHVVVDGSAPSRSSWRTSRSAACRVTSTVLSAPPKSAAAIVFSSLAASLRAAGDKADTGEMADTLQ